MAASLFCSVLAPIQSKSIEVNSIQFNPIYPNSINGGWHCYTLICRSRASIIFTVQTVPEDFVRKQCDVEFHYFNIQVLCTWLEVIYGMIDIKVLFTWNRSTQTDLELAVLRTDKSSNRHYSSNHISRGFILSHSEQHVEQ